MSKVWATGVEHVAEVRPESVYEAGALALQRFRRAEWSREAPLDAGTLRVEVYESTFYNVKVAELEAWLRRTGGSPRDVALRPNVRSKVNSGRLPFQERAYWQLESS